MIKNFRGGGGQHRGLPRATERSAQFPRTQRRTATSERRTVTVPTGFGSESPPLYFNFTLNFARLLVSESLTRPPEKVKFRSRFLP